MNDTCPLGFPYTQRHLFYPKYSSIIAGLSSRKIVAKNFLVKVSVPRIIDARIKNFLSGE